MTPATPRAARVAEGRWVGGVCTGLAVHLGWPVAVVRLAFLLLALADGMGVMLYLALWAVLPLRQGPQTSRQADFVRMLAFGSLVVGAAILLWAGPLGQIRDYVIPMLVLGLGAAVLWQQRSDSAGPDPAGDRLRWVRPVIGGALVSTGVVTLLIGEIGWLQGLRVLTVLLLLLGGAALLALPWLIRSYRDYQNQNRALIREQERTEIATQVHDSVLQTLTLIQQNAADPDQVSRLARGEERRLRSWLYQPAADADASLAPALQRAAADVETEYGATIDVVQVGDTDMSPQIAALVAATTEAMVNAAKHAGPQPHVSVYCEAGDNSVQVFVRDRGPGFDPQDVPADRYGVRESIIGRMQRAGGTASVLTADPGTEVRLAVDLSADAVRERKNNPENRNIPETENVLEDK